MNQIYYLFMLFSLLFLIETKAINILISFVGLILTLAFMLPIITYANNQTGWSIESEYYSYILILVQVSALTILFGFIIMLFPTLSHSTPISPILSVNSSNTFSIENATRNNINIFATTDKPISKRNIIIVIITIILIVITLLTTNITSKVIDYFYIVSHHLNLHVNTFTTFNPIQDFSNLNSFLVEHKDTLFLRKLGFLLYSIDYNIIKLLILTIILLLAIISLFFLIIV